MSLPNPGELRTANFYLNCVACGARYRPKYFFFEGSTPGRVGNVVGSSDHVCKPRQLRKHERELRQIDEVESPYCECDDIDCKFEFLDQMKNEME